MIGRKPLNAGRMRWYGLRVGDVVTDYLRRPIAVPSLPLGVETDARAFRSLVVRLDFMDNNHVYVLGEDGRERSAVAELLVVEHKIEDQNSRMGPPYPSLVQRRVLFLLHRGWRLQFDLGKGLFLNDARGNKIQVRPNAYSAMRAYNLLDYSVNIGATLKARGRLMEGR